MSTFLLKIQVKWFRILREWLEKLQNDMLVIDLPALVSWTSLFNHLQRRSQKVGSLKLCEAYYYFL
jgi:hypothetical protein